MRRLATILAILVIAAACTPVAYPTPAPVVWGVNVPEAAPEVIASQPVLGRRDDGLTLLPVSPTGAVVGTSYSYAMPLCGIRSPIDVDGSFWDAIDLQENPVTFDGTNGTFRLTSHTTAEFTSPYGPVLHLIRHSGSKDFGFCM